LEPEDWMPAREKGKRSLLGLDVLDLPDASFTSAVALCTCASNGLVSPLCLAAD